MKSGIRAFLITAVISVAWSMDCAHLYGATQAPSQQKAATQDSVVDNGDPFLEKQNPEEKLIQFDYKHCPWDRVIEDFTEDTGLTLQPYSDYPDGAFTLFEETEYTVMEGLDKLNFNLGLKGYTLIRNGEQLFLVQLREISPSMIETVPSEGLGERGLYETMRVQFDLDGLDAAQIQDSVRALITNRDDQNEMAHVPTTNSLRVRGKGWQLRLIAGMIDKAKNGKNVFASYEAKFLPPQQLLSLAGPLFGLEKDSREVTFDDSVLMRLTYDPLGSTISVVSSQKHINHVFNLFSKFDVDPDLGELGPIAPKVMRSHFVNGDKDVAFQVMQTMLAGRDVRMEQDGKTGDIILLGTEKDHADAKGFLAVLNENRGMKLIPLQHKSQATMITMLQKMFGQTTDDEGNVTGSGPTYIPVPDSDSLFVSGTPQDVATVTAVVERLDVPAKTLGGTEALAATSRYLPMSESESDRMIQRFPQIYPILNRGNKLNIVLPEDRKLDRSEKQMMDDMEEMLKAAPQGQTLPGIPTPATPAGSGTRTPAPTGSGTRIPTPATPAGSGTRIPTAPAPSGSGTKSGNGMSGIMMDQSSEEVDLSAYQLVSYNPQVGETTDDEEDSVDEETTRPGYVPAEQPQSVPGSPITISKVDGGLIVHSKDLSALDDIVNLMYDLTEETSEADLPAIFYMQHRRPEFAKALLDQLLGIGGGGGAGGGGGGLGGLVGGVVDNALGPAGDLFGGLLGGGLGGGGGASESSLLEGSVTTLVDNKLQALIVQGHTINDYELIVRYIEYIDQPEPPHDPDFVGQMYTIPIVYRDPELIREKIQNALAGEGLVGQSNMAAGGGGGGQEAAQAQFARTMQQMLAGGGNGGGSSVDTSAERPTIVLDVDMERRALLVTGPEFIYEKVLQMVQKLDQKLDSGNQESITLHVEGVPPEMLAQFLQEIYPGQLTIVSGTEEVNGGNSSESNGNQEATRQQQSQLQQQQQQLLQAAQRARQQQQGGRGGGRNGGGGGGGRGGGGRGAGGRGGR